MNAQYSEYKLVKKCLKLIEEKLNWGTSDSWHNDVFIELSEKIHQETNVLLSPTTLKRVWGRVNYNSAPNISTLNTLAQFSGYQNWRDFKNNFQELSRFEKKVIPNLQIIVGSAIVLTFVILSLFSLTSTKDPLENVDFSKIKFSSRPITKGLPNSVVFDFNLSNIKSDSIYVQQFWDRTKTFKISSDQKQATGIYYYPGPFAAKLVVEGQIIREHNLFIESEGWLGTLDYEPVPKYIESNQIFDGKLAFSQKIIDEIKSSESELISSFHYIKDFKGVSGDNFNLKTTIKNVMGEKWAVCKTTKIVILGTSGAHIIPFTIPGCVSDINLLLNDTYLNGKKNDLSAFGVDLSEEADIEIDIQNKQVRISVNNKEIYSGAYNESIGDFVGMRYRFLGAIEVTDLKVSNNTRKLSFDF